MQCSFCRSSHPSVTHHDSPPPSAPPPVLAACLRDLQRFLRRDDPCDRPAFMKLGELQVVQNDVISLITGNPTDTDLVYNACE